MKLTWNWKTILGAAVVLLSVVLCLIDGGGLTDCLSKLDNSAVSGVGIGLLSASVVRPTKRRSD